jgi:hypothetical protein
MSLFQAPGWQWRRHQFVADIARDKADIAAVACTAAVLEEHSATQKLTPAKESVAALVR